MLIIYLTSTNSVTKANSGCMCFGKFNVTANKCTITAALLRFCVKLHGYALTSQYGQLHEFTISVYMNQQLKSCSISFVYFIITLTIENVLEDVNTVLSES